MHMLMISEILCILIIYLSAQLVDAINYRGVGFLWSTNTFSGEREPWGIENKALDAVFPIAVEHFNERNNEIISILGSDELKECQHNLTLDHIYDTIGMSSIALDQYLYHQTQVNDFDFVFGPGTSSETAVMAVVAGVQQKPIIGYWATSPGLADKNTYPTFARADPADDSVAVAQAEYFKYNNYSNVALLFMNNGFGVGFKDALFTACAKRGILLHFAGFDGNDDDSIINALKSISQLKINIISLLSYTDFFSKIAKYADEAKLSGPGKLWLFQSYDSDSQVQTSSVDNPAYRKLFLGSIKINPTILDDGGPGNIPFNNWRNRWPSFEKYRAKMNTIYPSANGYDKFDYSYPANFFTDTQNVIDNHMAFEYDAIISLGLAVCKANATGKATGSDIIKAFLSLDFYGMSGHVKFLPNGNRDPGTITFLVENIQPTSTQADAPLHIASGGYWDEETGWHFEKSILYSSGNNVPPTDIDIPEHKRGLIPIGAKQFGVALIAITWISCLFCAIWLGAYKNERLLRNSQPLFLALLIVGVCLSNSSIFALMVDEGEWSVMNLNQACMAFPWLFTIGFMLGYFALFAKTYRILLLFHNPSLKKKTISAKPALFAVGTVLLAESIVLIAWTVDAPLVWKRTVVYEDQYGNPVESNAACVESNPRTPVYAGLIIFFHAMTLAFGAYVSTAARSIPQEFQESRWIALAMGSTLQIFLIGIPTVVATYTTSSFARFMSFALIVFVTNSAMLGFIYLPKILELHFNYSAGTQSASSASGHQSMRISRKPMDGVPQASAVASGNLM